MPATLLDDSYIKDHQFQFPLAHIYNHDPVYGKSGTAMTADTATAEQFQNYLLHDRRPWYGLLGALLLRFDSRCREV